MCLRHLLAILGCCLALGLSPARAATFTVTSVGDTGGSSCAAICTLRQAIAAANLTPAADTIAFNISGAGPHVIRPASALPQIDTPLTLDAYTQPGSAANTLSEGSNAILRIQIDGAAAAGTNVPGLTVCVAGVSIRGLAITRFSGDGIRIGRQIDNSVCTASAATIAGNFIGLEVDGSTAAGNSRAGILTQAQDTLIGGTAAAARNVIGENVSGVELVVRASVLGNLIGTDRTGLLDRGNFYGVIGTTPSSSGTIGQATARNRIAFNTDGIVQTFVGSGLRFSDNDIGPNSRMGVDLSANGNTGDGPTPNDPDDADTGGNQLQNFPEQVVLTRTASGLQVSGRLDRPATAGPLTFLITLYANPDCSSASVREGQRWLQQFNFNSTGAGNENFTSAAIPLGDLPVGTGITLTATDPAGNTSEFSDCVLLDGSAPAFTVSKVADTNDGVCDSDCSLREAIVAANASPDGNTIRFAIGAGGFHTIDLASPLPTIAQPVLIDGYTQVGATANSAAIGSNASLRVTLRGTGAPIPVCGNFVRVRGLVVHSFSVNVAFGVGGAGGACSGLVLGGSLEGNFIGLGSDGSTAGAFAQAHVFLSSAPGTRIGGALPAQRNLIGGMAVSGVALVNAPLQGTRIDGNSFGSDRTGTLARGMDTAVDASNFGIDQVAIGSLAANDFRFNAHAVRVTAGATGISAYANHYALNDDHGIDLIQSGNSPDGATANDADDLDDGGNHLQNHPVPTSASSSGGVLTINGSLDVAPAASKIMRLAAYASPACDASGRGEGAVYLGYTDVLVRGSSETFQWRLEGSAALPGQALTMTATDDAGNTSELSGCAIIADAENLFRSGFE